MSDIKIIEPTMEYAEDIWKFRQEIIDSDDHDKFAGCGNLEDCSSASTIVDIHVKYDSLKYSFISHLSFTRFL